jgi:hypothetical protein
VYIIYYVITVDAFIIISLFEQKLLWKRIPILTPDKMSGWTNKFLAHQSGILPLCCGGFFDTKSDKLNI